MTISERIEPQNFGQEHKHLQGEIPLAQFIRAAGLFVPSAEKLTYDWQFSLDRSGRALALLRIKASLNLICQSCQQEFHYPLQAEIKMKAVRTEKEAEALPLEIQPLYMDAEGRCAPFEVIEDELILNIPDFPRHEKKHCSFGQNEAYYGTPLSGDAMKTYKPFANLKVLTKADKPSKEKK